jgi:hypothetical protein
MPEVAVPEHVFMELAEHVKDKKDSGFEYTYTICELCGEASWDSHSKIEEEDVTKLKAQYGGPCIQCKAVAELHPQIFVWVCKVLEFHNFERHTGEGDDLGGLPDPD